MFGVADYESTLKIKKFEIADLMWQTKMQNLLDWDDILYAGFLGSLIDAQNSGIHKGGSDMADEKINKLGWNLVLMEFCGRWLRIRIWNSEIKNGGPKCKITWFGWNLVLGGLWDTDYEFELKIHKFKMTAKNARNDLI